MPDTGSYYHAGYVVAGALYAVYALGLWRRAEYVRARLRASRRARHL